LAESKISVRKLKKDMQGTASINEWFVIIFRVVVYMNVLMAHLEDKLQHCIGYLLSRGFSTCYLQAFKLTVLGTLRCPLNCTVYTTMIYCLWVLKCEALWQ